MKYATGEETKRKIIDAGFQLLADKGFDAMSIDEIMKMTGKTKGSFYVHFKTKEELLYEVVRTRLNREFDQIVEDTLKELSDEACNVQSVLKRLMHKVNVGTGGADRATWASAYYQTLVLSQKHQTIREWLAGQYHAWVDFMLEIIRRGQELGQIRKDIDARIMVNMLISLLEGYELRFMVDKEIDVYEQVKLVELLCTNQ